MSEKFIELSARGRLEARTVAWNHSVASLYERSIAAGEARLGKDGPLIAETGAFTGRSPNDKFIVDEPSTTDDVWWGSVNRPISQERFDGVYKKVADYARDKDLYVFEGYAGADPAYRIPIRVVTQRAWHSIFSRNMFVRETDPEKLADFEPEANVIDLPGLEADPSTDGTNSTTFILLHLSEKLVLIGGTEYAGEIKKSIFGLMKFWLPKQEVLSMHCSANYGTDRDEVALFFGLSGTGKTALSADASRTLIGDDEHGWSDDGVFNIEGGCYAKVIRLREETEPEIYATTKRFGTILENVVFDETTRELDLDDGSKTENTRSSYPVDQLDNVDLSGIAGHPKAVVFLACDAFGVLPPIGRLDEAQTMYHFLSGYTAKVAGTERGVTEPTAVFSTCFAAPFMPLHPAVYARMLGEKIRRHGTSCWLINTGWTGGPYGVGERLSLPHTRAMVRAALSGELDNGSFRTDPVFGVSVPLSVDGVPSEVLDPRSSWSDTAAYDERAAKLAAMFAENFAAFAEDAGADIVAAGPCVRELAKESA